jgi:broad specificity phosphatase PhoE
MIDVILVRHAESEANALGIVNGDATVPYALTDTGRRQAAKLGHALSGEKIDLCVDTGFARARETADVALAGRDVPRVTVSELGDPVFGTLEGRPLAEVREWFVAHGAEARPHGGESRVETIARYTRGFTLVAERPEATVLVVTHALPVTAIRLALEGGELPLTLEGLPPGHAAPYRLTSDELAHGVGVMSGWVREAASR